MTHVGGDRVTILAFDGIVADTLPQRATVLAHAMAIEWAPLGVHVHVDDLLPLLPGRTFGECVTEAVRQLPALQQVRVRHDATAHDLIAMRAQRDWGAAVAHGVPLRDGVLHRLHAEVARGVRLVLRSDSQRREVEPVLRLAGLEDSVLFLRCADDLPRTAGLTTLQGSYEAIDVRLDRQRRPRASRDAVEAHDAPAALALGFAATSRTAW